MIMIMINKVKIFFLVLVFLEQVTVSLIMCAVPFLAVLN